MQDSFLLQLIFHMESSMGGHRGVVGRIMPPKDVHVLIPRTCNYVNLHGKGNFACVIKLKTWDWGCCPGLFWWVQCNYNSPQSGRERQKRRSERWHVRTHPAFGGFENGGKRPWAKEWGQPLQAEKGKETDSPLRSFQKEHVPADTSILVQWD